MTGRDDAPTGSPHDQPDRSRLMNGIIGETWRPIPGFDGYEASDCGRIRSLDRWVPQMNRKDKWCRGRLLRFQLSTTGYLKTHLGAKTQVKVHRIIALVFLGPCPKHCEVAHIDGDRRNNRLSNLRYDTRAGNNEDKRKHGTHIEGEKCQLSKLTENEVLAIYALKGTASSYAVAAGYNCGAANVRAIWHGRSWRSITGA